MTDLMRQDVGWPYDHELNWAGLSSNLVITVAEYMWVWMGAWDEQMQDIDKREVVCVLLCVWYFGGY